MIWALIADHAGDNAQVLALAEELGLPFETKKIHYTWRKRIPGNNRRVSLRSIDHSSRRRLGPPWPDLAIIVGPRAQPIGRYLKKASGGGTKLVLIGKPRAPETDFDLIFDTRQYLLPDAPNVRPLPLVMSRYRAPLQATAEERSWLNSLPRPHLLMMVGGPIRYWSVSPRHISTTLRQLLSRAERLGGSLIVVGSPRTPRKVLARVRSDLAGVGNARIADGEPRFQVLMDDADELFPTGDSVSMISESIIAGKPVGIVPVYETIWGRMVLGPERRMAWNPFRDLRRFWTYLWDRDLAGTIDQPLTGKLANPVVAAAEQVRELLDYND